jgi:hypothetical protein
MTHWLQIIARIFGPVLTVTLFATLVAYLAHRGVNVHLTNTVIPVVAVVVSALVYILEVISEGNQVGLILVFRLVARHLWEASSDLLTLAGMGNATSCTNTFSRSSTESAPRTTGSGKAARTLHS